MSNTPPVAPPTTTTAPSPVFTELTSEVPTSLGAIVANPKPVLSALLRLTTSSKGLVVLFVVLGSFLSLALKAATFEQVQDFLKWILGPWFVASSAEDVSRNLAAGKVETMKVQTASMPTPSVQPTIDLSLKTGPSIAPPPVDPASKPPVL